MTTARQQLIADLDDCRIVELERHIHPARGSLTVAQDGPALPLTIRRVFYIYDIPAEAVRGGHAHHLMNELIVAASGCFDVTLTDGRSTRTVTLRRPSQGLYVPAGIWRSLSGFSSGAVCLTLCDTDYEEADYIRDYDRYLSLTDRQ